MLSKVKAIVILILFHSISLPQVFSQKPVQKSDTFFLLKKKGLLGKLGQSISKDTADPEPVLKINPYLFHTGKIIRSIKIMGLGFERNINDTNSYNNSFGVIVANAIHKNTSSRVIKNNLFFKKGDIVNPYLLADNERHLREQPFIQDAIIVIEKIKGVKDFVDVLVLVKDVFSLGGSIDISSTKKFRVEAREENFKGSGSKIAVSTLYDNDRNPKQGLGAIFLRRNIWGSFINWETGFQNYRSAFNGGGDQETIFYTRLEKPLVSQYIPWVGALDLSLNRTHNAYRKDSLYSSDFQYNYNNIDAWFGYNFGSRSLFNKNYQPTLRKFIAVRTFSQHFTHVPGKTTNIFDSTYSDVTGIIAAFSIFRQNFYRSNFIYGFGRNEDVPQGFSVSVISGYTKKQFNLSDNLRARPYLGLDGILSRYNKKGFYSAYTFRLGGYRYKNNWEDVNVLFNVEHFTRLKKINPNWYRRFFVNAGFTKQWSTVLNPSLNLNSQFGLPYFNNGFVRADLRTTVKTEAVFFNMRKFWGFRLAPFVFGDASMLKQVNEPFKNSNIFSAVGAGIRTRNENLIFGTIELRGYYFPRTIDGMKNFNVEFNTNIRFKYNSTFIRKPEFVIAN